MRKKARMFEEEKATNRQKPPNMGRLFYENLNRFCVYNFNGHWIIVFIANFGGCNNNKTTLSLKLSLSIYIHYKHTHTHTYALSSIKVLILLSFLFYVFSTAANVAHVARAQLVS